MTNKRHPWDKEKKELILSRDNHECFYCGATKDLAIDHIIPISKGGDNTMGNLVTSCKSCNSQKHAANLLPVFYNQVKECVEDRNLSMGIPQDELAVIVPSEKALLNAGLFGQKGAGSPDRPNLSLTEIDHALLFWWLPVLVIPFFNALVVQE